ncbi:L,D-transpeptidase family protein [Terasakiella sp. SH-1]|uniref:L,D-transpeptidase family protein n=1 Tax=Terasakiella sp. SH-1 TaxID=2560057 RepID=UPI0010740761|nr:L,D-transpeptidase family protein [Terasakiella sp. SH-1]
MNLVIQGKTLSFGAKSYPCAIGKGGVRADKREGDGASPIGSFAIRRILYRADRVSKPETRLPVKAIGKQDGWCDDPDHILYNRAICLPFKGSHEKLWREDHIYDIIVILGHNDAPPVAGKGSAIFFHLARENYEGTEGCIAVKQAHMFEILKAVDETSRIEIG